MATSCLKKPESYPARCRALQLDNMLLHSGGRRPMLRICDFGYSKDELGQSVSKSTCGESQSAADNCHDMRTGSQTPALLQPCTTCGG